MEQPDAASTVALILGASQFRSTPNPEQRGVPQRGDAVQVPAFPEDGVDDTVVHDLFDLNAEQSTLDDRVTEFLSRVDEAPAPAAARRHHLLRRPRLLLRDGLLLALRKTRPNKPYSGYPIKALAQTLQEKTHAIPGSISFWTVASPRRRSRSSRRAVAGRSPEDG